jgi:hypothetical protein
VSAFRVTRAHVEGLARRHFDFLSAAGFAGPVLDDDGDELVVTYTAPGRNLVIRCAQKTDFLETTLEDPHGRALQRVSSRHTGRAWSSSTLDDAFFADAAEAADWVGAGKGRT